MEPRLRLYLTRSKDTMETQNTRIRQTRVTHCITVNALQTRWTLSDKLAIELCGQRIAPKVVNLQLPHLHLTYPTCILRLRWGDPVRVLPRSSVLEN